MDFEDKKTKIIIIAVSCLCMAIFGFVEYRKSHDVDVQSDSVLVDYNSTEDSNIERVKQEVSGAYERKVDNYSFSDYTNDQNIELAQTETNVEKEDIETKIEPIKIQETSYDEEIVIPKKKISSSSVTKNINSGKIIGSESVSKNSELSTNKVEDVNIKRRVGFTDNSSIASEDAANIIEKTSIKGAILQTKKVKSGDVVLIRTTEESTYNSRFIPQNTILEGVVRLGNNRLEIDVSNVRVKEISFTCALNVYDVKGNRGFALDGNVNYEIKNETTSEVTGGIISETSRALSVPYLDRLTRIGDNIVSKKVEDPTVTLYKGQKLYLQ